jgi:putative colanic acid biosysnthesis UDP-glucose lipid carrier transferase
MIDETHARQQFLGAPPSVPSVVAAILEPGLAVAMLWIVHRLFGQPFDRPASAMAVLLVVLMFPGTNRFKETGLEAFIDIALVWLRVLFLLALLGYATDHLAAYDSSLLTIWAVSTPIALWASVLAVGAVVRRVSKQPQWRRRTVIVGANRMAERVAEMLARRDDYSHHLLGFFDDRTVDRLHLPPDGLLLGRLSDLPAFIEANGVKDVFITLPLTSQPRILGLMESLQNTTASLHFVPDIFGVSIIQGRLEDINGVPVVGLLVTPFTGINGLIKRASDIVLAILIMILVAPVMLLVAIGVRLSSPGPIIFRQQRMGLDCSIIEVYKFRSMRDEQKVAPFRQATKGDPRITPFGSFIRRTSLDELPQFMNVLQGSMSIVGPRPHVVSLNDQYRSIVKAYMARHKVKPGVTGWAQVNGQRGETDTVEKMARRVEYDLEYLRNWSIGLDLLIIFRTAVMMFFDRKAY